MKDWEVILLSQNLSVVVKGDNRKFLKNTSLEYFFQLSFLAFGKDRNGTGQVLSCPVGFTWGGGDHTVKCRVYMSVKIPR